MASLLQLKKDFAALAKRDRLSHAYLLFGESQNQAITFAEEFAASLERGDKKNEESQLLDVRTIDAGGEDEGGIESVRSARHFLYQAPFRSSKRTLIVRHADRLTPHAQNALLKLTEEPPPHALLFLIVLHPETLIPALLSRFQKIFVSGTDKEENEGKESLKIFLGLDARARKDFLKTLVEDERKTNYFLRSLLVRLRGSLENEWPTLKELLHRMMYMNQFSVNRRLQLEAALQNVR